MPVSEDFRRSMSMLHQQVQALAKDNQELRKEVEDLRKTVERGDQVNVKKKDDLVKRAVLTGDQQKIAALSADANTLVQDELLRHAALSSPNPGLYHPKPDQTLLTALIAAKQAGAQMPGADVVVIEERQPTREERLAAQVQMSAQVMAANDRAQREADRLAMIEASRPKQSENALTRLSPLWRGPMDNNPDF